MENIPDRSRVGFWVEPRRIFQKLPRDHTPDAVRRLLQSYVRAPEKPRPAQMRYRPRHRDVRRPPFHTSAYFCLHGGFFLTNRARAGSLPTRVTLKVDQITARKRKMKTNPIPSLAMVSVIVLGLGVMGCEDAGQDDGGNLPADVGIILGHVEALAVGGGSAPLAGASVEVGATATQTTTDADGNFELELMPDETVVLTIQANTYLDTQRIVTTNAQGPAYVWATLRSRPTTSIDVTIPTVAAGGQTMVSIKASDNTDFAELIIEAGDLTTAGGAVVDGDIKITAVTWSPAVDPPETYPGPLLARDPNGGAPIQLTTFGMLLVEMKQGGESVNVASGQTVRYTIKVDDTALADQEFASQNLKDYTLDDASGLWVEEGASVTYDNATGTFTADVEHFSHRNCDSPYPHAGNGCVTVTVSAIENEGTNDERILDNIDASVQVGGQSGGAGCYVFGCSWSPGSTVTVDASAHWLPPRGDGRWRTAPAQSVTTSCSQSAGCSGCATVNFEFKFTCDVAGDSCTSTNECCTSLECDDGLCIPVD